MSMRWVVSGKSLRNSPKRAARESHRGFLPVGTFLCLLVVSVTTCLKLNLRTNVHHVKDNCVSVLHTNPNQPLVLPNIWDVGGARLGRTLSKR